MKRGLQAILIALACAAGCMRDDKAGMPTGARKPSASPIASPSPLTTPEPYYASPVPYERLPVALPPGQNSRLWVYDRLRQEVFFFPGAGFNVVNVSEWNPYQFYFDDGRNIYLLDALREVRVTLVDGFEVGGFAFYPSFDGKNNLYFIGTHDPELATQGIGFAYVKAAPPKEAEEMLGVGVGNGKDGNGKDENGKDGNGKDGNGKDGNGKNGNGKNGNGKDENGKDENGKDENGKEGGTKDGFKPILGIGEEFPLGPILGRPAFLSKVNAVAVQHGGITSIGVDGPGDWLVFTTGDGGLYLYDIRLLRVQALLPDELSTGRFHAIGATIDPVWGRYVVWTDSVRQSIFILDRWTRRLDTVPYVAIAWDADLVLGAFEGSDPFNVVLLSVFADGSFRVMNYNLLTELLTRITWLDVLPAYR